jgi:Protein of unknown function (DUF3050)
MPSAITAFEVSEVRSLDELRNALTRVREKLLGHPLYEAVDTLARLRVFMSDHVFAVWDFMCLAKRLQRDLTSCEELWLPPLRPSLARFINSVVLGEESDVDPDGNAASHFGLYLTGMKEVGAATEPAQRFVGLLRDGVDVRSSLVAVGASEAVQRFVSHTLNVAMQGSTVEVLAAFLYGREDLIPEMFSRLLPQWGNSNDARGFAYYVKRHIEVDGDEHGPAGLRALAEMAAGDGSAWQAASRAAHSAIVARIALWDSVHARLVGYATEIDHSRVATV